MVNIELKLERPAHGGYTVGRHEGKAVFVRYGLPGERVQARITQEKKRFAFADTVEVIEASRERVTPVCPHFGVCGGCHWQHVTYKEQLHIKMQIVAEQFARVAGITELPIQPWIIATNVYGYRVHATFHGSNGGYLGFVGADGRNVVRIDTCPILRDDLNDAFERFKMRRRMYPPEERLRLQVGDDGTVTSAHMMSDEEDDDHAVGRDGDSAGVVAYTIKGRTFRCSAGAFFQVNPPQAEHLIDQALARLDLRGGETVLDLYSGGGLFSAFIAPHVEKVIAVEGAPLSVEDARVNLAEFDNIELRAGGVEDMIGGVKADAALVDPPRAGMKPASMTALIACEPKRIAYVSCDPATLARDAKRLIEAGYALTDVQPVDMFPQTYHIECVAGFVRD